MSSTNSADNGFFYVLDEHARLLFADDDPILREFAKVHLATENAEVIATADGEEAWDALTTEPFDIALVDLEMPRLDGFGLVRRMRADPRTADMPIIVCTGREDISAIDRAFQCGATGFVTKPINWRLLSYQVRFVLRAHRTQTSLDAARADADEARSGSLARSMMLQSAELLSKAMKGDEDIRGAARRYAGMLSEMVSVEAEAQASKSGQAAA